MAEGQQTIIHPTSESDKCVSPNILLRSIKKKNKWKNKIKKKYPKIVEECHQRLKEFPSWLCDSLARKKKDTH